MTVDSEMHIPLIRIRSLKSIKWGDVYNPVLYPCAVNVAANIELTEPLPLVPATWIHF